MAMSQVLHILMYIIIDFVQVALVHSLFYGRKKTQHVKKNTGLINDNNNLSSSFRTSHQAEAEVA